MKPVSCQRFLSPVNTGQPQDNLVGMPLHCSKCGFATLDEDFFKKHMYEHMGSRLFCFYCHSAVSSKAELNAHLEEHILKSSLSCPHCGQRYMRKMSLLKHIESVHHKNMSQTPKKIGGCKDAQVSNALTSMQTTEHLMRPLVRVNVPTLSTPTVSFAKDGPKARTMLPISSNAVPNNVINNNRALTVSLPEEISIPAGCMVELMEVKTVNGSKELKLRLVSQENEAGMKDTRTTVQPNVTAGKTLASTLSPQNAVKSTNMGMCTMNRKQVETKPIGQQCATVKSFSNHSQSAISNQGSKEKFTLKRTSQEIINLDTPVKVPKTVRNPVRKRTDIASPQSKPFHDRDKTTDVRVTADARMLTCIATPLQGLSASLQRIDENPKSIPPSKAVKTESSLLDMPRTVKLDVSSLNNNTGSKVKNTPDILVIPTSVNQQSHKSISLNVSSVAAVQTLQPKVSLSQQSTARRSTFPSPATLQRTIHGSLLVKPPVGPSRCMSNIPAWTQGAHPSNQPCGRETPKPEGFPVISSVFSLSEYPGEAEGAMQPLVMALRDIVMDKSSTTDKLTSDVNQMCRSVKVEGNSDVIQQQSSFQVLNDNKVNVKVEKICSTQADNCSCDPCENSKPVSNASDACHFASSSRQYDISKFLTVPLARVDERGVCMDSWTGTKAPASQYDTMTDNRAVSPLMPLKAKQLVTWPGPNQPVVVLNHPKPRVSMQETLNTVTNTGILEKAPKCQIIKMRLGKVIGQKYEVTGCTVRFSQ